ncbi:MAG: YsnF/AvaK domain-containing protein [Chloroflexi bacterium]|nr:YsnF/AvaK domain-containing protein [Chloroflexota bacterium]
MDERDALHGERPARRLHDEETHATTGGAAAAGAATGGVIGAAAGPVGAIGGALAGGVIGAGAERAMHADDEPMHSDDGIFAQRERDDLIDAYEPARAVATPHVGPEVAAHGERVLELKEEQLVAHKELREAGFVQIRKQIEEVPSRLEVDAYREEIEVEHIPVGQIVKEQVPPWEEDGMLIVPVYEEQLVVMKRLLLKEHLRIRRVATTERQVFEDTVRRERLVVEDHDNTGYVHEQFPVYESDGEIDEAHPDGVHERTEAQGGFFESLVRRALK